MEIEQVRLHKDQERIRIAFDIVETLESMIFFRGPDNTNPRILILRMLQKMSNRIKEELERED